MHDDTVFLYECRVISKFRGKLEIRKAKHEEHIKESINHGAANINTCIDDDIYNSLIFYLSTPSFLFSSKTKTLDGMPLICGGPSCINFGGPLYAAGEQRLGIFRGGRCGLLMRGVTGWKIFE